MLFSTATLPTYIRMGLSSVKRPLLAGEKSVVSTPGVQRTRLLNPLRRVRLSGRRWKP